VHVSRHHRFSVHATESAIGDIDDYPGQLDAEL